MVTTTQITDRLVAVVLWVTRAVVLWVMPIRKLKAQGTVTKKTTPLEDVWTKTTTVAHHKV